MSYAIAKNEAEAMWRVYCNVCRKDIGTMTAEVLKQAMTFAIDKGGVMCPECRAERCKGCGLKPRYRLSSEGLCVFCGWDREIWEDDQEPEEMSCLVNLNSRDRGLRPDHV